MKYYIFIQNDNIIGAGQGHVLTEGVSNIEISEDIYNMFEEDKDLIYWDSLNKQIIKNPKYNDIKAQQREEEFNRNFFPTSLGYIKRQVTMKNGVTKDFITDLIPLMMDIPGVPVIVYGKPDFTQEVTDKTLLGLQKFVKSTPELIKECRAQAIIDFYGYNPVEDLLNPSAPEVEPEVEPTPEPEVEPTPEPEVEPTPEPEVEPTPEPEVEPTPEPEVEPEVEPTPEEPATDEIQPSENVQENLTSEPDNDIIKENEIGEI